jgi:hypothetical protein
VLAGHDTADCDAWGAATSISIVMSPAPLMPDQREQDDHRNRNAEQKQQNTPSHRHLP